MGKKNTREGFSPSKYSKVCSLHFLPSDFKETRSDSNLRRHNRGALKLKMLKPTAYPSILPNLPFNLSTSVNRERPTIRATASSRLENENSQQYTKFLNEDVIHSLQSLVEKFQDDSNYDKFTLKVNSFCYLLISHLMMHLCYLV